MREEFRIGYLAQMLGVAPQTIRDHERRGTIPPARRSITGFRIWRTEDIPAIREAVWKAKLPVTLPDKEPAPSTRPPQVSG